MINRKMISIFLILCTIVCSVGCNKPTPVSEQLATVYDKYQLSSTVSTVNLDSGGYYTMEKSPSVLNQPSSIVVDYIVASKRIPDTGALTITYAEFNNELDTKNTFEKMQNEFKDMIAESGTGYYDGNCVIGFYVPQLGNHDNFCVFSLLYRTETQIIYVYEQGPVSYVDQNQALVNDVCNTIGFNSSETYTTIRKTLDE